MSATNHSKKAITHCSIGLAFICYEKNIVANVQEVKQVTLEFTV